jgi:outer membrane immunogenic protein
MKFRTIAATTCALASLGAFLVPETVVAADLGTQPFVKAKPVAFFDWTGAYAGAFTGLGVQRSRAVDPTGARLGGIDFTGLGAVAGVTLGYNWQFHRHLVAGVEGDIGWLGLGRSIVDWNDSLTVNSKTSWIGTVRGRIGYTSGPTLSYLTGGWAVVSVTDSAATATLVQSTKTLSGYAYGSGVETALGGNWTAKAEYLRVAVGKGDVLAVPASVYVLQTDHQYDVMKFGVNYLFGARASAPLPARNWTGFYAGIVGGSGSLNATATQPATPGEIGANTTGYTVGAIAGYNWQFAPHVVAGVEGDISWIDLSRSLAQYNDFSATRNAMLGVKTNWYATLRGRVGYSTGPALLYVTAGGAWANVRDDWQGANGAAFGPAVSSTKTLSGYAAGGGIETPIFFDNLTSRTEYLYVDVGRGDLLASTASMAVNHRFHLFRSSLTYHFGR